MWKQLVSHQFEKWYYDANPDVGTFLSLRCPPGQPARTHSQRPGAAMLTVNRELVLLYWQIGREILLQQDAQGWGRGDRPAVAGPALSDSRHERLLGP